MKDLKDTAKIASDKKIEVAKTVKVTPKKDHKIRQNSFSYDLKVGEEIEVASHFIPALKAEKVID